MSCKLTIVYASTHGQVARIARHVADVAATQGITPLLTSVHDRSGDLSSPADAYIVIGSIHFGRHARKLEQLVIGNRERLSAVPSAFISVSGAAASLEGRREAEGYRDAFLARTGWRPDMSTCVAGAILYTKYDWFTRTFMKYASRLGGRPSDTSRDYEFTDWFALDAFADEFVNVIARYRATA